MSKPRDPTDYHRPRSRAKASARVAAGEADRGGATEIIHAPKDMWAETPRAACGKSGRLSADPACEDVTCKTCLKRLGMDE